MAADLVTVFESLENTGFYEYALPFLLVFAMVYGLMDRLGVLPRQSNAIVGLAFAFYAAFSGVLPALLFEKATVGQFGLLLVVVLMLMIGAELTGFTGFGYWDHFIGAVAVGGIAILLLMRGGLEAVYGNVFSVSALPVDMPTLMIIGVALLLMGWMIWGSEDTGD